MSLFKPFNDKGLQLKNRIVMAPMTRARNPNGIPNKLNALYYKQRAGAGLIITEGTAISPTSMGVLHIPGLYTDEQVEGWKLVTQAVHEEGSKIFTQLWHVGRVSHVTNQPGGIAPVSSSDIQAIKSFAWGYDENGKENFVPCTKPRPLATSEVKDIVHDFAKAAANAVKAGFDGIEIHGANGYLIEQFLNPFVNNRMDEYGGDIVNRSRFLLEVIDACVDAIGAEKVAIRLTPYGGLHELPHYDEIEATYKYLAEELSERQIAYVHIMDQKSRGSFALPEGFMSRFKSWYKGIVILAGGMDKKKSDEYLSAGIIDLAGFGEPFIANPDLADRLRNDWPLTPPERHLHYGGAEHGYTDYPLHQSSAA
ncbi:alkene reductase [Danxiaibacter flavus]|uniref:Alkene reductase n=1 Tax=Danxiaibacter flavus TaxID=3049108 RepID=A0ABV3Z9A2_9BACT|nr:alkene reductase [Chitinophagaceae bacterium DXS]